MKFIKKLLLLVCCIFLRSNAVEKSSDFLLTRKRKTESGGAAAAALSPAKKARTSLVEIAMGSVLTPKEGDEDVASFLTEKEIACEKEGRDSGQSCIMMHFIKK